MKRLLKFLHLLGVTGFGGGSVVALVLSVVAPNHTAESFAVARAVISIVGNTIVTPGLLLATVTGAALMASKASYLRARWVWVKAMLAAMLLLAALALWLPAVESVGAFAASGAFGAPVLHAQDDAQRRERWSGILLLALSIGAIAIAVWRPKLGGADGD